jgi:hypothetical protein
LGPRTGLDAVGKRKIPSPRQESNLIIQSVEQRYTTELFQLLLTLMMMMMMMMMYSIKEKGICNLDFLNR